MYTDEQFEKLEREEYKLTDEELAVIILLLANTKRHIEEELFDFYRKYGNDGIVAYQEARKWVGRNDRRKRLAVLLYWLNSEFNSTLNQIRPKFKSFLTGVIGKECEFFDVTLDIDDILSQPWGVDNLTWLERLENDVLRWNSVISTDIKRSLLRRDNIDTVLEQLNKRFESIESIIRKLGITESTAVGSIARREIFKALGVSKYRFYTQVDERRCETCGSMHGLVFPITAYEVGVTASPMHPFVVAGKFLLSEIKTFQLKHTYRR